MRAHAQAAGAEALALGKPSKCFGSLVFFPSWGTGSMPLNGLPLLSIPETYTSPSSDHVNRGPGRATCEWQTFKKADSKRDLRCTRVPDDGEEEHKYLTMLVKVDK